MNFFKTPSLLKRVYADLLWDKRDEPPVPPRLYLTFDDGPVPEVTPWVWDTLAQFDARATFFCVGENVDRYPELYQETLRRHHAVGNHTYHHLNAWRTDSATYQRDIDRCAHALHKHHPPGKKTLRTLSSSLRKGSVSPNKTTNGALHAGDVGYLVG